MEQHKRALIGLYIIPALLQSHWFYTQHSQRSLQEILILQKKNKTKKIIKFCTKFQKSLPGGEAQHMPELVRDLCPPHRLGLSQGSLPLPPCHHNPAAHKWLLWITRVKAAARELHFMGSDGEGANVREQDVK